MFFVKTEDDYNKYSREWLQNEIMRTPLLVFPEGPEDNVISADYYYRKTNGYIFGTEYQICLEIKYNDNDFREEKERLRLISAGDKYIFLGDKRTVEKDIVYDEENYLYPAYAAVSGDDEEYALIDDGGNRIIYIYLTAGIIDIKFDRNYLPSYYFDVTEVEQEVIFEQIVHDITNIPFSIY